MGAEQLGTGNLHSFVLSSAEARVTKSNNVEIQVAKATNRQKMALRRRVTVLAKTGLRTAKPFRSQRLTNQITSNQSDYEFKQ